MSPIYVAILTLACFLLSAGGTRLLIPILKRHVMDTPNARSNHKAPVPRGGGIALIGSALIGMSLAGLPLSVAAAALLLACISFIDDMRGLPAGVRLLVQLFAVALALGALPDRVLPDVIPHWLEYGLLGLAWLWFINLTNFMDGIDGISAMEAILVALGIVLVHLMHPALPPALALMSAIIAASCFGFYCFNRSPATIFLGDVGSIPLGFLMGYLLLSLASYGHLAAALILPAYYVTDATVTLVRRQLRGQKVWQAHTEHAYQQAVRSGLSHTEVVRRIALSNLALIVLALASTVSMMAGIVCLIAAYGLTYRFIQRLSHAALP